MNWQPIETAPKDGTDILVYCGPINDPMIGVAHWSKGSDIRYAEGWDEKAKTEWISSGWMMWWQQGYEKHSWPTHWMPLPEFPCG